MDGSEGPNPAVPTWLPRAPMGDVKFQRTQLTWDGFAARAMEFSDVYGFHAEMWLEVTRWFQTFVPISRMILPIDQYFSRGLKPPTSRTKFGKATHFGCALFFGCLKAHSGRNLIAS